MDNKAVESEYMIDVYLAKFGERPHLKTLRRELKRYADELHTVMTKILKTETEAIVNLVEHLTNVNAVVFESSYPIYPYEEIKTLHSIIKNAEDSLDNHIEKTEIIDEMCNTLKIQMNWKTSVYNLNQYLAEDAEAILMLDRAVNELSFQSIYLKELYAGHVKIDETIHVEHIFKALVDSVFIKSLRHNMQRSIVCCLRTYVSLNRQEKAEQLYSEKIVEPVLIEIFTEKNVKHHNFKLDLVYAEALQFLNTDVKNLVDLVNSNGGLKGFNFIMNSYWKVTDKLIQENLSNITLLDNLELFQRYFQNTWKFLLEIANQISPSLIYERAFQNILNHFNLLVYFDKRSKQMSHIFEMDLIKYTNVQNVSIGSDSTFLKLNISKLFWRSVKQCFHPEVFIAQLAGRFVILSLYFFSRYLDFINNALMNESILPSETFVVNAMVDIETLKNSLGLKKINHISTSIYKNFPQEMWKSLETLMKENEIMLNNTSQKLGNYLIYDKVLQSNYLLQEIVTIPSLYRRTNRTTPTETSIYVIDVVKPWKSFYETNKKILKANIVNIMDNCINQIGEEFLILIKELLHSVTKMEELLTKLKSISMTTIEKSTGSSDPSGDPTSDEGKIREQIKLDVKYFVTHMTPFVSEKGQATLETLVKESGCSI